MEIRDELKSKKLSKRKIAPILLRLDLDFLGCGYLGLEVSQLINRRPGSSGGAPTRTAGIFVGVIVRQVIAAAYIKTFL